jgi:hypothetical protein
MSLFRIVSWTRDIVERSSTVGQEFQKVKRQFLKNRNIFTEEKKMGGVYTRATILAVGLSIFGGCVWAFAQENGETIENPQVIHLVEQISDFAFIDEGAAGPSLGDRLVFTSDLFETSGDPAGQDGADCVVVRIDTSAPPALQQIVQCTITVKLEDGQITFQGLAQGTSNTFAVTGGTGAYRKARGEALAVDRMPLQTADITITLKR